MWRGGKCLSGFVSPYGNVKQVKKKFNGGPQIQGCLHEGFGVVAWCSVNNFKENKDYI